MKLYRGKPIQISNKIIINQPTLGDIVDFGEDEYFNFVSLFTSHHLNYNIIILLNEMGLDFNKVSDWEVFFLILSNFGDGSKLLFPDLDFSSFSIRQTEDSEALYLENNDGVIIDETIYKILVEYVRVMNGIPKPKFNKVSDDPIQKQMAIDDAKRQLESIKKRNKFAPQGSQLLPMISSVVNHSGFKHDENTVFNMKLYAFLDSVSRLQIIEQSNHLYQGLYSGCLDLKKNPSLQKEMNWMRKIQN